MTSPVPKVGRKTVTVIQQGSVYKEEYLLPTSAPTGATARQEWRDSAGTLITQISGTVSGNKVTFRSAYSAVASVPDGAGFYTYVHLPTDGQGEEHLIRYGTTFRRQLSFPGA